MVLKIHALKPVATYWSYEQQGHLMASTL